MIRRKLAALCNVFVFPGAGVFQHREYSAGFCGAGAVGKILRKEGELSTAQESCSTAAWHGCTVRHESYCGEMHSPFGGFFFFNLFKCFYKGLMHILLYFMF